MSSKSPIDQQIAAIAEAQDISVADAARLFVKNSDNTLNLDDLPSQKHSWTDRGLKWTCENAGHPYHEAWRIKKATM